MKITQLSLSNFMMFADMSLALSPKINILCGGNNTGKTALLKILYSSCKSMNSAYLRQETQGLQGPLSKDYANNALVSKIQGVFQLEGGRIGRLVSHKNQNKKNAEIDVAFSGGSSLAYSFGSRSQNHVEFSELPDKDIAKMDCVFIPPKEIISALENFVSLYQDYHIAFEETYYDLARLLIRPRAKSKEKQRKHPVLKSFEEIMGGELIEKKGRVYLRQHNGTLYEMGLLSEGYRKLATLIQLTLTGSLSPRSILFWDEPETNMNPSMIEPVTKALAALSKLGVQVFITTHDYFVQQSFNLMAAYPKADEEALPVNFLSLYPDEDGYVHIESAPTLEGLTHNPIMEEFDALYDREQELIYENN